MKTKPELKNKLLILAGRSAMISNGENGAELFASTAGNVVGGLWGGMFSLVSGQGAGGLDSANPLEKSYIDYLRRLESDKIGHGLYDKIMNASPDNIQQLQDCANSLEEELKKEGRDKERIKPLLRDLSSQLSDNIDQISATTASVREMALKFEQQDSPMSSYVPTSSLYQTGARSAGGGGDGAGPARGGRGGAEPAPGRGIFRAGPPPGAAGAGFGGGGGGEFFMSSPSQSDLIPPPYYPPETVEPGPRGRAARPEAHTGPDNTNASAAGVAGGNPLPPPRGRFEDGPPPRRAGDGEGGVGFGAGAGGGEPAPAGFGVGAGGGGPPPRRSIFRAGVGDGEGSFRFEAGAGGGEPAPAGFGVGAGGGEPPPRRSIFRAGVGDGEGSFRFEGEPLSSLDRSTMLLPGQADDLGGPGPERRVEVEGSFPPIRGRVDEVRGGEGAWGDRAGGGGVRFADGAGVGGPARSGVEAEAKREGGLVKAVKEVLQEQVGNRFDGLTGAGRGVAGVADALLAGNTGAASMRVDDFVDNVVGGIVLAESRNELQGRANIRREEDDSRRTRDGIPTLGESQVPKIVEATSDHAGAFFVDAPLHVVGAAIDAATLDFKGAKKNAEAVGCDLFEGAVLGKSLQEREAAEERRRAERAEERRRAEEEAQRVREVERAEAERADRLRQQQIAAEIARLEEERGSESSPRNAGNLVVDADLVYNQDERRVPLRRASAMRDSTPLSLDEEDDLKFQIRKSGLRNYLKSFIPSCCSCCFCGLEPEFEEYKPKRNSTYTYEIEEGLFEKAKEVPRRYINENSHLQIDIDQDNKRDESKFISVSNNANANDFLQELTFESIKEEKKKERKNTLFKIIRLEPDAEVDAGRDRGVDAREAVDNRIQIGGCKIGRLNIVDLKSNTYKTKIYLDDEGINTIKDFTERNKALFLQYFLNDPNLTAKSFLETKPMDIPPNVPFDPHNQDHQSALKKASEAVERLVERKMERGDFKFDLDDPNKEIAYVKVLREIDKNGNVKKDNKVEIKTGKEFSEDLKHINLHVGDSDYIQIHLEDNNGSPKVSNNLSFFRKDGDNNFNTIELKSSSQIRSSKIKIISHDNKETKFKSGNITQKNTEEPAEEKKSSCFPCIRKAKPKIKESGVIRYDDGGWNIEFEKEKSEAASAKLIMSGSGKISFDEKDSTSRELADAFRKALGDKNEVRKFKLVKDNETYEVTIGNTQTRRTFRNNFTFGRGRTHGNGILKVEKISGDNLTEKGAIIDNVDEDGAGRRRSPWTSCFSKGSVSETGGGRGGGR